MSTMYVNKVSPLNLGETITIDGVVSNPKRPAFRATSTQTIGYSTSGGTIIWNHTLFNVGNGYNTTTGVFTAPVSGVYGFSWNYYTDSGDQTMADLIINGGSTSYGRTESRFDAGNNTLIASGLVMIELNKDDYVKIINTENGGGTAELIGSSTEFYNYFNGFLIS